MEPLSRLINKLIFLEKKSIVEIDDVRLYPSEIHLLLVIDADRMINAITMAKTLGVSKGAVSQTLTRLEKKGILVKRKDPAHRNELSVVFTDLGERAIKQHHSMRASLQAAYASYLESIPEADKRVIHNFLARLETFVDKLS